MLALLYNLREKKRPDKWIISVDIFLRATCKLFSNWEVLMMCALGTLQLLKQDKSYALAGFHYNDIVDVCLQKEICEHS